MSDLTKSTSEVDYDLQEEDIFVGIESENGICSTKEVDRYLILPGDIFIRVSPACGVSDNLKLPSIKKAILKTRTNIKVYKIQEFIQQRLLRDNINVVASHITILFENV